MPVEPKCVLELFLKIVELPFDQREAAVHAACAQPDAARTADFRRDIAKGVVIAGRYLLQQKIGQDGMGELNKSPTRNMRIER